jgi:hypothetical protein
MSVDRFMAIFDGLEEAYGYFKIEKREASGKNKGKAGIVREPRTKKLWEGHLSGKGIGMGIIPINADNMCKWGCVDIDQYPLDHKILLEKIRRLKLPLVVCRSKSGGAHCFLFSKDWVEAKDMQHALRNIAAALGYGESEIFPKQIKLNLERGDVGNFLNLPYYDAESGLRYAFLDDGASASLDEFYALYDTYCQTPEQITKLQIGSNGESGLLKDGPPCLQILCQNGISEGGRNNGLFNIGVYLRKAYPDSWESEILRYNMEFFSPPLPLPEVNIVAKQVQVQRRADQCALQQRAVPDTQIRRRSPCLWRHDCQPAQVQLHAPRVVYGCQWRASGARHRRADEPDDLPACVHRPAQLHAPLCGQAAMGKPDQRPAVGNARQ